VSPRLRRAAGPRIPGQAQACPTISISLWLLQTGDRALWPLGLRGGLGAGRSRALTPLALSRIPCPLTLHALPRAGFTFSNATQPDRGGRKRLLQVSFPLAFPAIP
jgi:hypothetical protein